MHTYLYLLFAHNISYLKKDEIEIENENEINNVFLLLNFDKLNIFFRPYIQLEQAFVILIFIHLFDIYSSNFRALYLGKVQIICISLCLCNLFISEPLQQYTKMAGTILLSCEYEITKESVKCIIVFDVQQVPTNRVVACRSAKFCFFFAFELALQKSILNTMKFLKTAIPNQL